VLSPPFAQYLGLEGAADELRTYHPVVVPGQLQTTEYTVALLAPRVEPERAERVAGLRAERQDQLFDEDAKVKAHFVLDEAALRRRIGSPAVMGRQMDRLLKLSAHPRVNIAVLPMDYGAHYSTLGGFTLLGYTDDADLLYLEHATGSVTNGNDLSLLARYQVCFETILAGALQGESASALIEQIKEETGRS
jgi:hypothetical protein